MNLPWAVNWPISLESIAHENVPSPVTSSLPQRSEVRFKDTPDWDGMETRLPGLSKKVKTGLCTLHYAYRTEQSYLEWICRYVNFNGFKDPLDLGAEQTKAYLEYLATVREVSGSTQRQALNAIVFLYNKILENPLGEIGPYERPKIPKRLPVVLTRDEKDRILRVMAGMPALMAGLLYGSGLRLMERVRLRVKDVDFETRLITVRDGKGGKDRVTMLPEKYSQ